MCLSVYGAWLEDLLGVCLDELYVGLGAGASVRIVSVSSSMSCLTCCVCVVLGLMLSTCVYMCCSWGTGGKCCRDNTICALIGKSESVKGADLVLGIVICPIQGSLLFFVVVVCLLFGGCFVCVFVLCVCFFCVCVFFCVLFVFFLF